MPAGKYLVITSILLPDATTNKAGSTLKMEAAAIIFQFDA